MEPQTDEIDDFGSTLKVKLLRELKSKRVRVYREDSGTPREAAVWATP